MKIFNKVYTRKEIKKFSVKFAILIISSFVLALGTGVFLVPMNIISGGLSGIAIIIDQYLPGYADISITVMTWVLFAIGFFVLGKEFTFKTLVTTIFYPLFLMLVYRVDVFQEISKQLINVPGVSAYLLAGIFGSALVGIGVALSFLAGGSTGGVDIIVFIFTKYIKIFKESTVSFTIDALIILIGIIILWDPSPNSLYFARCLVNILSAFVSALMIEIIYISKNNSVNAEIISAKWEEINDYIQIDLERGSSLIEIQGGYANEKRIMIKAVFNKDEYIKVKDKIEKVDPNAFVTFTITKSVFGNGFTRVNPNDIIKK
ncbi:MAG: YitT family protein [Bacilli bacterium]